eukprot:6289863-Amphidinium_carterae.1
MLTSMLMMLNVPSLCEYDEGAARPPKSQSDDNSVNCTMLKRYLEHIYRSVMPACKKEGCMLFLIHLTVHTCGSAYSPRAGKGNKLMIHAKL